MFDNIPDEILIGAGVGAGVLALVVVLVIVLAARRGGTKAGGGSAGPWEAYARDNHLTLSGELPLLQLEGGQKGINVRFWQHEEEDGAWDGDGDAPPPAKIVSEAAVSIPADVGDLLLVREGPRAKLAGGQDIRLNDTQFDTAFVVRHSNPKRVFQILTPPVRDVLIAAQQKLPDLAVSDGMVRLRGEGTTDVRRVDLVLTTLIGVAAAFAKDA
jgi:hypothetical protein